MTVTLAHTRAGAGAPLVLLAPLGLSRHQWDPVIPALAARFDVLAVDVPGFGDSPALSAEVEPSPAALAGAISDFLDRLDIRDPHVVGNSLGGWIALELAALRPAASVTLLSPAGLWPRHTPLYCRVSLRASRWTSRHAAGLLCRAVSRRLGRVLVLGQTHGRPGDMSPAQARRTTRGRPPARAARHDRRAGPLSGLRRRVEGHPAPPLHRPVDTPRSGDRRIR